jgi:hypothetical protein
LRAGEPGIAQRGAFRWPTLYGETWRRLKVTFPDDIASYTREQTSYFGPDGLLRRHDYAVDVLGGATGGQYIEDYHEHGGS